MDAIKAAGYNPAIYGNLNTFTKLVEVNKLGEYDKWFALYDTQIYSLTKSPDGSIPTRAESTVSKEMWT